MAEKNTESTAVNQLIELVATAKPLPPDPSEDLMFREVKQPPRATKKISAPRMTSTVPPINGAGEVAPLPRGRAPSGTQQGLQTLKAVPPGVRVTTAPPSRGASIPPLTLDDTDDEAEAEVTNPGPATFTRPTTQAFAAPPLPTAATRATGSNAARLADASAADPIDARPTRPTLPPPLPTMRASAPPPVPAQPPVRPSAQPTSSFSYPIVPSTPATSTPHPKQMPVAAPYESDPIASDPIASLLEPKPLEPTASSSWLEHDIGTQQVARRNDWKAIAGKLIGPMVVLVIIGIFIGGYFAFDGDGGKKRTPKATEGDRITMPVTSAGEAAAASADGTNAAAPASADGTNAAAPASADGTNAAAPTSADGTNAAAPASADGANAAAPAGADVASAGANAIAADGDGANADGAGMAHGATAHGTAAHGAAAHGAAAPGAMAHGATAHGATAPAPITPPNLAATTSVPAKPEAAKPAAAAAKPAAANIAAAATAAPAPAMARPTLVDVRIDSNPVGATVMLIDRGKSTYLGTTPVSAAVDVSRKYELVFSYENRATLVQALDPSTSKRVSVRLSRAKTSVASRTEAPKAEAPKVDAVKAEVTKSAPRTAPKGAASPSAIDAAIDGAMATKPEKADKPAPTDKADKPAGEGTLMISSKPPCEILIDGKPTGLTTPQRAIALPAGAHRVTLVNEAAGIKKTVSVQITADKPTKVIQDFMK